MSNHYLIAHSLYLFIISPWVKLYVIVIEENV